MSWGAAGRARPSRTSETSATDMAEIRRPVEEQSGTQTSEDSFRQVRAHGGLRSPTAPTPAEVLQAYQINGALPHRSRNRSPYARPQQQNHRLRPATAAPPMTRAHSLPTPRVEGYAVSPRSSPRSQSPHRSTSEELTSTPLSRSTSFPDIQIISEDSELDITPRAYPTMERASQSSPTPALPHGNTFSRRHVALGRRPASPLHQILSPSNDSPTSNPSPSSTPFQGPRHSFDERYPGSSSYSVSNTSGSMPSTPTSMRSRSPSISSLETIEDTPDAEEQAAEKERGEGSEGEGEAGGGGGGGGGGRRGTVWICPKLPSASASPRTRRAREKGGAFAAPREGKIWTWKPSTRTETASQPASQPASPQRKMRRCTTKSTGAPPG